ncbi:carbohydrate ABC transporter permease [Gryllotalpicola reticulitermitis]|uniref:Carbohydrate ABC transporter permease n=1 Tax=Gryllotalpicola reticulitermitis TaxID=1184153 RepID=A0ABV8Q3L3_9MICO
MTTNIAPPTAGLVRTEDASLKSAGNASRGKRPRSDWRWALLFIFPSAVGFIAFYAWPLIRGIYLSFTSYNILQPPQWIGLQNYKDLASDGTFWNSLLVTIEYVVVNIGTQTILALVIAVIMERLTRSLFIRIALVFPWLVPNVAIGILSLFMLDRTVGIVNHALTTVHLPPQDFYQDPHWAIITVALVNTWRNVGYTALLLFAGIQLIPRGLYEAASLDGASEWALFRRITMPLLRPILALVLTVSMIGSFQIFDTVSVVYTQQPIPAAYVLYYYVYQAAFSEGRMGYASAIAVVLLIITAVLTFVQLRLLRASESDLA